MSIVSPARVMPASAISRLAQGVILWPLILLICRKLYLRPSEEPRLALQLLLQSQAAGHTAAGAFSQKWRAILPRKDAARLRASHSSGVMGFASDEAKNEMAQG